MARKEIFTRNGFEIVDQLDRFELHSLKTKTDDPTPALNNWKKEQLKYQGWNLVYSNQCPWHEKSITDLSSCALENGIDLNLIELSTPQEAQKAPSGFGTYSLIRDGRLLEDHYLSKTRFRSILKQELDTGNGWEKDVARKN